MSSIHSNSSPLSPTDAAIAAAGLVPYSLRLAPGDDLKEYLQKFIAEQSITAGCILTTVGSLQQASLRFAGQKEGTVLRDRFEIVSLVGTLSPAGLHLHLAIADAQGHTVGGHVLPGCLVYTTAEIVLGALSGVEFQRCQDAQTGYQELVIKAT